MTKTGNKTELAQAVGVSRKNLLKHLGKADAPEPDGNGEWDVEQVRGFVEAEQALYNHKGGAEVRASKNRYWELRCKELERKLEIQGRLISVDEFAPLFCDFCQVLRFGMIAYINAVCPKIDSQNPVRVIKVLRPYLNGLLVRLAEWLEQNQIEITSGDDVHPLDTLPAAERLVHGIQRRTTTGASTTTTQRSSCPRSRTNKKGKKK